MRVKIKRPSRGRVAHLTLGPEAVYFRPLWASVPTAAQLRTYRLNGEWNPNTLNSLKPRSWTAAAPLNELQNPSGGVLPLLQRTSRVLDGRNDSRPLARRAMQQRPF